MKNICFIKLKYLISSKKLNKKKYLMWIFQNLKNNKRILQNENILRKKGLIIC